MVDVRFPIVEVGTDRDIEYEKNPIGESVPVSRWRGKVAIDLSSITGVERDYAGAVRILMRGCSHWSCIEGEYEDFKLDWMRAKGL